MVHQQILSKLAISEVSIKLVALCLYQFLGSKS